MGDLPAESAERAVASRPVAPSGQAGELRLVPVVATADAARVLARSRSPALALELGRVVGNQTLARAIAGEAGHRVLARDLSSDYEGAVKRADWKLAAEYLNGFNREDIVKRLGARTVDEIEKIHQGALDNKKVGGQAQVAQLTPPLLTGFAKQFRDAANVVWSSPEAMKLVAEGVAANVKYGGFSEEGPGKTSVGALPYTIGDTIYVPKARLSDKVTAMKGFLFEINNAVRSPRFADVSKRAKEGKLTADQYARSKIELEVEGMLRMGKVWAATKAVMGGGKDLDKYDALYYLAEHLDVEAGKKTAADIAADVGKRKYEAGTNVGKTVEQFYVEQFNAIYGKKK
jgi:hypothetical protein